MTKRGTRERNWLVRLVSGFQVGLTPRGVIGVPPYTGRISTKPTPFFQWVMWKPMFRWWHGGKSVTWLIFHAGYVPYWLRRPWTEKEKKDFMYSITNERNNHD